jgi:peptide-methionine (R)-S-oxide reductase
MTEIRTDRRTLLTGAAALVGLAACAPRQASAAASATEIAYADSPFRKISDAEWRKRLPGESYGIMRHEDTEMAGSGPFLNEHRKGIFTCKGCDLPLFKSEWKFESGTGWPSFYDVMKQNIGSKTDHLLATEVRTAYHCARCLAHQGHVFHDGPRDKTGLRYCNNGYALNFKPA